MNNENKFKVIDKEENTAPIEKSDNTAPNSENNENTNKQWKQIQMGKGE